MIIVLPEEEQPTNCASPTSPISQNNVEQDLTARGPCLVRTAIEAELSIFLPDRGTSDTSNFWHCMRRMTSAKAGVRDAGTAIPAATDSKVCIQNSSATVINLVRTFIPFGRRCMIVRRRGISIFTHSTY